MTYSAVAYHKTMVKVLPHVIRSINELNIPAGNTNGFEILYFGVNLLLMFDYRLSFNIELRQSDRHHQIELFIISRKDVSAWKNTSGLHNNSSSTPDRKSTRLNSSHANISYAVFCLKKKKNT